MPGKFDFSGPMYQANDMFLNETPHALIASLDAEIKAQTEAYIKRQAQALDELLRKAHKLHCGLNVKSQFIWTPETASGALEVHYEFADAAKPGWVYYSWKNIDDAIWRLTALKG